MKPRLLYLAHCYYNRGGVEEHLRDLAEGLDSEFDIRIIAPEQGRLAVIERGQLCYTLPADPLSWPKTLINQPLTLKSLEDSITSFKPDLIHIQHFFNWPLGMIETALNSGVPVIISFHDYYAVHPIYTILEAKDTLDSLTPSYNQKAFGEDLTRYLSDRHEYLGRCFERAHTLIVPSKYLSDELKKVYAIEPRVIEHGIPEIKLTAAPARSKLRFGALGSKLYQKGWMTLLAAFAQLRLRNYDCELLFIGGGSPPPIEGLEGISYIGSYSRDDLDKLLPLFDVGVIPSLFAETFSYVLSEMQAGGKPVAASDIGSLGTRVNHDRDGKLFKPGGIEELTETLIWFIENEAVWRRWEIPTPRFLPAMLDDYRQLYNGAIGQKEKWQAARQERSFS